MQYAEWNPTAVRRGRRPEQRSAGEHHLAQWALGEMGALHSTVSGSPMKFDPAPVLRVKEELRQQLAAKPVAEKLRILDELRAASVALRAAGQELRRSETDR
jgi:hypothetical protein